MGREKEKNENWMKSPKEVTKRTCLWAVIIVVRNHDEGNLEQFGAAYEVRVYDGRAMCGDR